MVILETCAWSASDCIEWVEGSGCVRGELRPRVDGILDVRFSKAPSDMTAVQKPGRTILWRAAPLRRILSREEDTEAARRRPEVPSYDVEGEVIDPDGRYLPRRFAAAAGFIPRVEGVQDVKPHQVKLFRSPLGARFQAAGGVIGRLAFGEDVPASWAVVTMTVTLPVGGPLEFVAQADGRGDFRVPLSRLPALTKDAPAVRHPAKLRVRASRAAANAWIEGGRSTNPDELTAVLLRPMRPPVAVAAEISLEVAPGEIVRLASSGRMSLLVQAP